MMKLLPNYHYFDFIAIWNFIPTFFNKLIIAEFDLFIILDFCLIKFFKT